VWAVAEPHRLAPGVRSLIESRQYAVSVASLWELIDKTEKRGAPVKNPGDWWDRYVVQARTPVLPIRARHMLQLERIPWHHRDPYDRILIAQSLVEGMPLVTADAEIRRYEINTRQATA
jgi:PIN domain nuclease of toxin-antitoxin system